MNAKQVRARLKAIAKFLPAWDAYVEYVLGFVDKPERKAKPDAAKFKKLFAAMRRHAKPLQERMAEFPRWTRHGGPCLLVAATAFTTPESLSADIQIDRIFSGKDEGDPLNELARRIQSDAVDYANELRAILPVAKDKPDPRTMDFTDGETEVLRTICREPGLGRKELASQCSGISDEDTVKRIVNGRKDSKRPGLKKRGLVTHSQHGGYRPTAEALRIAKALRWE